MQQKDGRWWRVQVASTDWETQAPCRYVVLALCTGYHPVGSRGDWLVVTAHDADVIHVPVLMTPVRVNIILSVKELVPYDDAALNSWRQQQLELYGAQGDPGVLDEEVRKATVVLQDGSSDESTASPSGHRFLAVPVHQDGLVSVKHLLSGAAPPCLAIGAAKQMS